MATKNLFPLGIATGAAHCNRKKEREALKEHVRKRRHAWLWARRRMGKTSLIEQVMGELERGRPSIPSVKLDLNIVHDAESLEERIREAVARLSVALLPGGKKARTEGLLRAFERFAPEFSVGGAGLRMTLRAPKSVVPGITDVLLALDAAAGVHKARGVIVMDEFQQISGLTYGKSDTTLEGAIRHAVERAQNISYVFSGSQRHLLETMFVKDDRPLLRHCIKMSLSRIDEDHYRRFLDRASKAQWSKTLDDDVTEKILALTLRHPYYVNALCSRLWDAETPPGVKNVSATWSTIVEEDASMVSYMVRDLSATQRAMLIGIALAGAVEHPLARTFLESVRLSASTGSNAKDVLEADDLIRYSENNEWELVDPVMAEYLRSIST